eukprot:11481111-Alexandrium_andersonii.AAC.1
MVAPNTAQFKQYQACGRVVQFIINATLPFPVRVVTFYAWPCGEQKVEQRKHTQALFSSLFQELDTQPR